MDIKKLESNLNEIRNRIDGKAELLAVTKTVDTATIIKLISLGLNAFGENRVNVAEPKINEIKRLHPDIKWHMIGHLQSNKVKSAVRMFDMIQSVDSIRLAKLIDKEAGKTGRTIEILIEVNISQEEQKHGIPPNSVFAFFEELSATNLKNVKIKGIMAMAPFVDSESTRPYFRKMKAIFDTLKERYNLSILSIGMTNDYEIAVQEGSTMVRVGTALYDM